MELNKIKSRHRMPSNKNLYKKIAAVVVSIAVFAVSLAIINRANAAATDTVAVLRVSAVDGIPEKGVISESNLERYHIIRREYTQDMVLADDLNHVVNKYATHYLRNKAILHIDEMIEEKPLKNEWLYMMADDEELLTIPYNYLESGGNILTPGDRIRVRVIYEIDSSEGQSGNYSNDNLYSHSSYSYLRGGQKKVEELFHSIEVKDMLNSNSHSIYEVYREVLRLPENQRQEVLKSSDFIRSIVPRSLIVSATSDEINKYLEFRNATGSKSLLVTILPRAENTIILDQLPTLQKEIELWLEKRTN